MKFYTTLKLKMWTCNMGGGEFFIFQTPEPKASLYFLAMQNNQNLGSVWISLTLSFFLFFFFNFGIFQTIDIGIDFFSVLPPAKRKSKLYFMIYQSEEIETSMNSEFQKISVEYGNFYLFIYL